MGAYTQFANLTAISALIILTSLGRLLVVLRALVAANGLSRGERWLFRRYSAHLQRG